VREPYYLIRRARGEKFPNARRFVTRYGALLITDCTSIKQHFINYSAGALPKLCYAKACVAHSLYICSRTEIATSKVAMFGSEWRLEMLSKSNNFSISFKSAWLINNFPPSDWLHQANSERVLSIYALSTPIKSYDIGRKFQSDEISFSSL